MKTVEDGERFNQFVALHKKAVWNQVLKSVRDGMGNPNWSPNSITGMGIQASVLAILRRRYKYITRRDKVAVIVVGISSRT
jgi:hypothetical protein